VDNQVFGTGVKANYFQIIDNNQDLLLSPMISQTDYDFMSATYRLRTMDGETKATASIASEPNGGTGTTSTVGWHVDAHGLFDIDDSWRAGYQVQRASDANYLQIFGYHPPLPYLETRPYVENFSERNYGVIEAYSFQSLSTASLPAGAAPIIDDPIVFPQVSYSYMGQPDSQGGYWTFDTRSAVLTRLKGTDTRRVDTVTAWRLPITSDDGQVYNLTTSVEADAYNSDNLTTGNSKMVNAGRGVPAVSLDWRFPLTSIGEHSTQIFQPIVMATASPYGGNTSKIPNEDSLDFELDSTNIFKPNPSNGYDRILTGPRVAYGAEYSVTNRGSPAADLLVAQSYRIHDEAVFDQGSGFDNHLSDVVGRANISPSSVVSFQYDFRLQETDLMPRRSEVSMNLGPHPMNLQASYVFYDKLTSTSVFGQREQVSGTLTNQFSHYWQTQLYTTQNVGENAGPLQTGFRVTYEDECAQVVVDAGSSHTTLKTFSAGHYFNLRIVLKTIGQIPVDVF
jgi:LPS-assembly protein